MSNFDRKLTILLHIQNYCKEVIEALDFFGRQFETFESNFIFRNTISMSILQIGELSKNLDREFKDYINETKDKIEWREIIRMRDRFAHHYGDMNRKVIFNAPINDIPVLNEFVNQEIQRLYPQSED